MDYIKNLLIIKEKNEEILRIDEFEKIIYILIKEFNLQNYINDVILINFNKYRIKRNVCALYNNKQLYFDYLRVVHSKNQTKVSLINLNIIKIILHELMHVIQERKIVHNFNNTESYILYASFLRKKELIKKGVYEDFYKINPIERQAEIISLQRIISMFKNSFKLGAFERELNDNLKYGYNFDNPMIINPYNQYFDNNISFFKLGDFTDKKRLELGLPVKKVKKW